MWSRERSKRYWGKLFEGKMDKKMKEKSEDEEDCVERRMKKNRMKIEAEYRGMK